MEQKTADLKLKALGGFNGTQNYYNIFGAQVTDGVKYIMENGYSWFVADSITRIKGTAPLRSQPFLTVKLKPNKETNEAEILFEDGNGNRLDRQHYGFSDAKREITLFSVDNVLMGSSEY